MLSRTRTIATEHRYACAVAGALAILIVAEQPLVRGTASPIYDALQFFGPYHMLVGGLAARGQLLLWNPFTNGGSPDYIEPQVGAVSPFLLVTAFASGGAEWGFRLYWFLIWFGAGAGVIVLGRHLGAPAWGCFCVACGFMLSGFYIGHAQHTPMLASASYMPWILWRIDSGLRSNRRSPFAEAGVFWGLSGLGGYPGVLVLNGMALATWVVVTGALASRPTKQSLTSAARGLLVTGCVTLIVLSPTYVAFIVEGRGFTHRVGPLPRALAAENNSLLPWNVASLAGPSAMFWQVHPFQDVSMRSVYVGVLTPALAVYALTGSNRRLRAWIALGALFFAASAFGESLPVRGWLYDVFPPTRYFRHAALFRMPAMLFMAILALLGTRDLRELKDADLRRLTVVSAVTALALCSAYAAIGSLAPAPKSTNCWTTFTLWAALPTTAFVSWRLVSPRLAITALAATLVVVATTDAIIAAKIGAPQVYGRDLGPWQALDAARRAPSPRLLLDRQAENLSNFNMPQGVPVLRSYAPLSSALHAAVLSEPILRSMALGPDRFWFAASPPVSPLDLRVIAEVAAASRTGAPAIVLHSPTAMAGRSPSRRTGQGTTAPSRDLMTTATRLDPAILAYTEDELAFGADVPIAGWIVVTDRWAPGWSATVNGVQTPIWGANGVFRAIRVRRGRNIVRMWYRPFGYPWLVILSWTTVLVVSLTPIIRRWRFGTSRKGFGEPQLEHEKHPGT